MVLHECLTPADHRVYAKETKHGKVMMIIWVDDLIIATSNEELILDGKKNECA